MTKKHWKAQGKNASKEYELGFRDVPKINSALSDEVDVSSASILSVNNNPKRVFTGQNPCHEGFTLSPGEAAAILSKHPDHREVLFPYMTGRDLVESNGPTRWIIDLGQRDMLSAAAYTAAFEIRRIRAETLPILKGGLRALYRTLELPGANPLKDAHAALDAAVLVAYGFDPKSDLLAQVLELNQQVAARIENGEPVTAPGLPLPPGKRAAFITDDCIRLHGA